MIFIREKKTYFFQGKVSSLNTESTYKKYVSFIFIYILSYPMLIKIGGRHLIVFSCKYARMMKERKG